MTLCNFFNFFFFTEYYFRHIFVQKKIVVGKQKADLRIQRFPPLLLLNLI